MPTNKQILGENGEELVVKSCSCPACKREKTLKRLRANFKCADVICDFCGYLAQVKTTSKYTNDIPSSVPGSAWGVQKERMDAGVYIPLFLVQIEGDKKRISYLSADLQETSMFIPRNPLSSDAKRAGWQGFTYRFSEEQKKRFIVLLDKS